MSTSHSPEDLSNMVHRGKTPGLCALMAGVCALKSEVSSGLIAPTQSMNSLHINSYLIIKRIAKYVEFNLCSPSS